MKRWTCAAGLAIGAALLAGCEKKEPSPGQAREPAPAETSATPVIYTTFYPTEYFAKRIGGDLVEVVCPVPEDADAIFWQPSREEIEAYRGADLIVVNGAQFEKWIATASLPESRVVDTAAAFESEFVTFETTKHSHGPGGAHTHEGIDGHTWMDPNNAKRQAEAIRDAMIARFGGHEEAFRKNHAALAADLDALDARFEAVTAKLADVSLHASHPAYNYIAERYAWEVHNHDFDPESPIEADALAAIKVPQGGRAVLLWESEPLSETVSALEARGVRSVVFSPAELLGGDDRAAGEDYVKIMNANLDRLDRAVSGG